MTGKILTVDGVAVGLGESVWGIRGDRGSFDPEDVVSGVILSFDARRVQISVDAADPGIGNWQGSVLCEHLFCHKKNLDRFRLEALQKKFETASKEAARIRLLVKSLRASLKK